MNAAKTKTEELFDTVYEWGRNNIKVDHRCETFEKLLDNIIRDKNNENLERLIETIIYKKEYYFIQMSKKRVWYQTLDGKVLELPNINEQGETTSYADFVVDGNDIYDAMETMIRIYLEDEDFQKLLEEE